MIAVTTPIALLEGYLEICFFVVALLVTKELVWMVKENQLPNLVKSVQAVAPRLREVLVFSLKYGALLGVLEILIAVPLALDPIRRFTLWNELSYLSGFIAEACLAWLLVPSAIHLLRPPNSLNAPTDQRIMGTVLAVVTSAGCLALQYLLGNAEAELPIYTQADSSLIAMANTVVINLPQVMLFIGLALLATNQLSEETIVEPQPD